VHDGTIATRVYLPQGEGPFPVHVYLHGGGWWLGSIDGLQVLSIPVTDLTMGLPSVKDLADDYLLSWDGMLLQREYYLPDLELATHPYVSPLHAPNLAGLPPAVVTTMEYDPLRDEGEAYARRLVEAGVPTLQRRFLGQVHGSAMFTALSPVGLDYFAFLDTALRRAYAATTPVGDTS
jgi:acetyl esterase